MVTADEIDLTKPLHITVKVNGEVTQDDTTASMIKSFSDLIAYVSTFMTLKPGDIIVTGTPIKLTPRTDPPTWLKAGDTVEITVPEIGTLRNTVMASIISGEKRKAACVIGWPAGHSRSPLIHNYWIRQHNLDAEYRIEAMPPNQFGDSSSICVTTVMSAAMSRCRTSRPRWICRARTSVPRRSVPPTPCG